MSPLPSAPSLRAGPPSRLAGAGVWRDDGTTAALVLVLQRDFYHGG